MNEDTLADMIFKAAKANDIPTVELLLKQGADINIALEGAVASCNYELINFCTEKGANDWGACLFWAIRSRNLEIIQFVLDQDIPVSELNENSLWVGVSGNLEIIKMFIEKGANNYENIRNAVILATSPDPGIEEFLDSKLHEN